MKRRIMTAISYSLSFEIQQKNAGCAAYNNYMDLFMTHYFNAKCEINCPCNYDKYKQKSHQRRIPNELRLHLQSIVNKCKERASDIVRGLKTCGAEAFNSFRTTLTSKIRVSGAHWLRVAILVLPYRTMGKRVRLSVYTKN